ncbi:Uncharacterised protein [Klebsiella pneumoniae]|uniref:Uncharacterized protein n=1 Tax=Klebsiella pneumoniae TaxID=573 RepID=A0A3S4KC23_KLEPN|nr:Uncharacterised protein [Klebsiella pneumoniae]
MWLPIFFLGSFLSLNDNRTLNIVHILPEKTTNLSNPHTCKYGKHKYLM